jgi:hypothetical protein
VYDPTAVLRRREGLDVGMGSHAPPPGGPLIDVLLTWLLERINRRELSPYHAHIEYEMLHPFTNGNGWSGRAIWLWQRGGDAPLGFLHQFYHETLAHERMADRSH